MCNSIADGGLRCAAHLESAIATHEENYKWEVIKAANDAGVSFDDVELTQQESERSVRSTYAEIAKNPASREASLALVELNHEKNKYAFALETRDETEVARYLYENSDVAIKSKTDLARAKKLYTTRLAEIDYNEKAQKESGVKVEGSKVPDAEAKLEEAREHLDNIEAGIVMASAGDTDSANYDVHEAERNLAKAKEWDRTNFHAVFNADKEREKAESEYKSAQRRILNSSHVARNRAVGLAPLAIKAYRANDENSMRLPQGPDRGRFPDAIRKKAEVLSEARATANKEEDLLRKKAKREALREKISRTEKFKEFEKGQFAGSERGKEYIEKKEKLNREFKLTEKYEKQLESKVESAKSAGLPYESIEKEIQDVRQRRGLTIMARKNEYAKSLINA